MKIFTLILSCFIVLSSFPQYNNVTLKVNGNKNRKVVVDGKSYTMSNTNPKANNKNIAIADLQPGKHTIQVVRTAKSTNTTSTFILKEGFDMIITVNGTGAVQLKEKQRPATVNTGNAGPEMNTASFNTLVQDIQNQWQAGAKQNMIGNAFANTSYLFTAVQAKQLIQMVDAENARLQLAKASYRSIVDPGNFNIVYSLLTEQASRNELSTYVNNYYSNTTTGATAAMNTANYNSLIKEIQAQWQAGAKQTMINDAFANTSYYFTTEQAGQMIRLVDAEATRLQLAKASYRSITDRSNFTNIFSLLTSQASRNELSAFVSNYNNGTTTNVNVAMNTTSFNALLKEVQNQWQAGAKLNLLTNAFNAGNYFTSAQARQLIQTIDAESSRLQLAKAAYKTITDVSNYNIVSELLDTQASRNDLAAYIVNGGVSTPTTETSGKVAMSDASFQSVIADVRNQWMPGSKMMVLETVFANTANYFSVAQVRQLVAFVTLEANRLQLLKASYRNLTDKANFATLYDMLSTQASRDELANYAKTYAG